MLYHTSPPEGQLPPYACTERARLFRQLGAAALSQAGLDRLCASEREAYAADPGPKSLKKLEDALLESLRLAEWYVAAPFDEALQHLRGLSLLLPAMTENGELAAKTAFRALFKGPGSLALSAAQAQGYLEFALEVLCASMPDGKQKDGRLLTAQPWRAVAADEWESLAGFLAQAVGALNTHDAKSSHPSAQYQFLAPQSPVPSRFLSSELFDPYVSGRIGGGVLQYVSWLEYLLPFRISVEGGAPVAIYELLTSAQARAALDSRGVTALSALPLVEPQVPSYDGKLMPRVRLKVPGSDSVSLNLMPANSLLRATAELGRRVQVFAAQELAQGSREACLEGLQGVDEQFSLERFVDYLLDSSSAPAKQLIKDLAAARKAQRQPALELQDLVSAKSAPGLRTRLTRHALSSKPQICGGAYLAEASTRGIYLFPAASYQKPVSVQEIRRFYGGLQSAWSDGVQKIRQAMAQGIRPQDKYQVGEKWLPVRVQKKSLEDHVERASTQYAGLLRSLREKFALTEDQRQTLVPNELSVLQHFVLEGVAAEAAVRELAVAGTGVLNINDRYASDLFVERVLALVAKEGESA